MPFLLRLKNIPELRSSTWKTRCQVTLQAGFAPFRHVRVWLAFLLACFAMLWMVETVLGNFLLNEVLSASTAAYIAWIALPLLIALCALLFFRHMYLATLRGYIDLSKLDPAAKGWTVSAKALLKSFALLPLLLLCMGLIDWTINSFDESPSPRIAQIESWPTPIPDEQNGFFAAIGLLAPPGVSPHQAGRDWITQAAALAMKEPGKSMDPVKGLTFVNYEKITGTGKPVNERSSINFCNRAKESCLAVVHNEKQHIKAWLAANQELLTRYRSLYQYRTWQYTTTAAITFIPNYSQVINGLNLSLAEMLLTLDENQPEQAFRMLEADIRLARTLLGAQGPLIDKMVAVGIMNIDLEILAQIIRERPEMATRHWQAIDRMLQPLSREMVSMTDTLRFEQRWGITFLRTQSPGEAFYPDSNILLKIWANHHYKQVATLNLNIAFIDSVIQLSVLPESGPTHAMSKYPAATFHDFNRLFGFMRNLGGNLIFINPFFDPSAYVNKVLDLNALNNLIHLQLMLTKDGVATQDVPAYLAKVSAALQNPETGQPFEWDVKKGELYFRPYSESFKNLRKSDPARISVALDGKQCEVRRE